MQKNSLIKKNLYPTLPTEKYRFPTQRDAAKAWKIGKNETIMGKSPKIALVHPNGGISPV